MSVVLADVMSCLLPVLGWGLSSSVIRKTRLEAVLGALIKKLNAQPVTM